MPQGVPLFFWLGNLAMGLATIAMAVALRDMLLRGYLAVERDLRERLHRLHVPTARLRVWLTVWLASTAVLLLVFGFALNNLAFGLLAATLLLAGPWYLIRRLDERRHQEIEDQLADAMVTLASAVRAGLSLMQALEILATQCPRPIQFEFQQMVGEYKLGKPLERVLSEARQRLKSENFALFAAALQAAHESGGRLNETVERIAQSVLELHRLERKVMSETAQARKSAIYMAIAPLFILVVYWFVDPENTGLLFTRPVGQFLLAVAVVLNVAAYLWARVILNPDI
jgi:tight adherence protein B